MRIFLILMAAWLCGEVNSMAAEVLQKFVGCTRIEEEWSDGDSFPVKFPDGQTRTVRLYGVDCLEMHVQGDESNARRLRDQRRYFGIQDITVAKAQGEKAKLETARLLNKPFTVWTAFSDGRGDGRFNRIYGFVTLSSGEDLSSTLVQLGLARAFGVVRAGPDGKAGEEWRDELKDLELQAAKLGKGAWAFTNWEKLPEERKEARAEEAEIAEAQNGKMIDDGKTLDPNKAARDELMKLPGIGEKTADSIIEARPFKTLDDLGKVQGIGPKSLAKLKPFLEIAPH
jgi:competence ComEA-like helix-hairpin-helix protein